MTEAILGKGTLLQRLVNDGWETIAEQIEIGGPSGEAEDVEVTNHDSPGSSLEYIAGLVDTGQITTNGNFIARSISQQRMFSDQKKRVVADYRIVVPDAVDIENRTKFTFPAYVKSINFTHPVKTQSRMNATFKVAGEVNLSSEYSAKLAEVDGIQMHSLDSAGENPAAVDLHPDWDQDVNNYGAVIANARHFVTVTPTGVHDIFVNGVAVVSEATSDPIPVDVGTNYIVVKHQEADKSPLYYFITVIRESAV